MFGIPHSPTLLGSCRCYAREEAQGTGIFVRGLPPDITPEKLAETFKEFGALARGGGLAAVNLKVQKGKESFAFVDFEDATAQRAAIAGPVLINGQQVFCCLQRTQHCLMSGFFGLAVQGVLEVGHVCSWRCVGFTWLLRPGKSFLVAPMGYVIQFFFLDSNSCSHSLVRSVKPGIGTPFSSQEPLIVMDCNLLIPLSVSRSR